PGTISRSAAVPGPSARSADAGGRGDDDPAHFAAGGLCPFAQGGANRLHSRVEGGIGLRCHFGRRRQSIPSVTAGDPNDRSEAALPFGYPKELAPGRWSMMEVIVSCCGSVSPW